MNNLDELFGRYPELNRPGRKKRLLRSLSFRARGKWDPEKFKRLYGAYYHLRKEEGHPLSHPRVEDIEIEILSILATLVRMVIATRYWKVPPDLREDLFQEGLYKTCLRHIRLFKISLGVNPMGIIVHDLKEKLKSFILRSLKADEIGLVIKLPDGDIDGVTSTGGYSLEDSNIPRDSNVRNFLRSIIRRQSERRDSAEDRVLMRDTVDWSHDCYSRLVFSLRYDSEEESDVLWYILSFYLATNGILPPKWYLYKRFHTLPPRTVSWLYQQFLVRLRLLEMYIVNNDSVTTKSWPYVLSRSGGR